MFLPAILEQIQSSTSTDRLLMLHALKEVILHLPSEQLEKLADQLWNPLFDESDGAATGRNKRAVPTVGGADIGDDGIRNVKAACIGKLTMTAPGKYLPQLQVCSHQVEGMTDNSK